MANIYDVAKRAGVSVSTVSAVVNGTAYVSGTLQRRVRDAIEDLGYRPNLVARSLAKQKSHMIGMIVPDISNPFWPQVVRGAEDRAHQAGYTLLLSNSDDDPDKEALYLNVFMAKRVDGILLTKAPGRLNPNLAAQLRAAKIPIALSVRIGDGLPFDRIVLDDRAAAYEAVTHLVRLGYRRIGIVNGLVNVSSSRQRLAGYKKALKDGRRTFATSVVCHGDFRVDSGYRSGLDILKQKPDAVFITNYLMAVGFMRALRQYQLRCPEDVAIVTCDDHPWLESFGLGLTTVNFPKYELGCESCRVLIDRLTQPGRPMQAIELKSSLTIRESCGFRIRSGATAIA
jgi:LacI family transcriptional regulator, galactose operon repressor